MSEENYVSKAGKKSFKTTDGRTYRFTQEAFESLRHPSGSNPIEAVQDYGEMQGFIKRLKELGYVISERKDRSSIIRTKGEKIPNNSECDLDGILEQENSEDLPALPTIEEMEADLPKRKKRTTALDLRPILAELPEDKDEEESQ